MFPAPNPTPSYWLHEGNPFKGHRTTPDPPASADVVILGAGVTGVSTLYHLTQLAPELSVVMLDARSLGEGATGRNAGMATPLASHGFRDRVQHLGGVQPALDTVAFERKCVRELTQTIHELGIADYVQLRQGGVVNLAESEQEWNDMLEDLKAYKEQTVGLMDNDMEEIKVWGPQDLRKLRTADGFYGGIHSSLGFQLWPFRLLVALTQHCLAVNPNNINLQFETLATGIAWSIDHPAEYEIRTSRGRIRAKHIVHATNAYVSHLVPSLYGHIYPVRGQMVAGKIESKPDSLTWHTGAAFNYGLEYLQQRDDGTLLLGGGREFAKAPGMEVGVFDDGVTNPAITEGLTKVFSARFQDGKQLRVTQAWTGIMGFSKNEQPVIGRLHAANGGPANQFVAAGFHGHGMPRCYLAAKNIVLQILGRNGEVDRAVESCFAVPESAVEPTKPFLKSSV
ncbi:FAD dependent oxidoreductase [Catenaria anguillulae PL171]|uniref:FAD dependent oxidoreductase n=1 Tax=Catenaria anguillulae PL171 TaxID=765915 RepID=A0A1Y2H9L5_9FUNG|nr:FAD dependent oxidoreductase [Catenaria anguillulae PL171]